MSDKKTPTSNLFSWLGGKKGKRERPSTSSSSEGTMPKVTKKSRSAKFQTPMKDIQKELLEDFDESEEEISILENFDKNMENYFKEFKNKIRDQLKKVVTVVTERIGELEKRVKVLEGELQNKGGASGDTNDMIKMKDEINRYGQYTKKDLARMFGVVETKEEDCRQVVSDIITQRLKIKVVPTDISVAHRVGKSTRQKHRPIIIRFKDRTQRYEIMKARKVLKGSGISIAEDMTRENMELIRRAEGSRCFQSVWFWNGKVCAKNKDGKKIYTLNLSDNFKEVIGKQKDTEEEDDDDL